MIKAVHLTHYYNKDLALENINLQINKGEFICLVGESGSGKSTLLSLLSTLLKQTSGQLFFEGKNYKDMKISIVLEEQISVLSFNFII